MGLVSNISENKRVRDFTKFCEAFSRLRKINQKKRAFSFAIFLIRPLIHPLVRRLGLEDLDVEDQIARIPDRF